MLRACDADMPHVGRQRRQKSAGIFISLVPQGQSKNRERVTQVVQPQYSAATPAWNAAVDKHLTKRFAQRRHRIEPTRRCWKKRRVALTIAKMILDFELAVLQAGDKVGSNRDQSGLPELRGIYAQNAGCEIDIDVGETECLSGAKSC